MTDHVIELQLRVSEWKGRAEKAEAANERMRGNQASLSQLITCARRLVQGDHCRHCLHEVDTCDCMLSRLRDAVLAWDESASEAPGNTKEGT